MVLKSKLLQAVQEKHEFMKKGEVEIVPITSQPVDTEELTRSLSQVSLKDQYISNLKEDKNLWRKQTKSIRTRMPS